LELKDKYGERRKIEVGGKIRIERQMGKEQQEKSEDFPETTQ
jgi:hypothetical protein